MKDLFKRLVKEEEGQGMVEYALILALVSVVAIVLLRGIGDDVKATFQKVTEAVS